MTDPTDTSLPVPDVVGIAIMGIVLEIGKLVAAAWVYNHWRETSILLRTYLVSAIIVLMLITSMGIYGFLSKSHIDAGINTGEISVKIERVDNRIASEQRQIDRAEKNILEMDTTLEKTEYGFFDDSRLEERKSSIFVLITTIAVSMPIRVIKSPKK